MTPERDLPGDADQTRAAQLPRDCAQWLHSRGQSYARSGQERRGLTYLLMAYRICPDDIHILRSLIGLFTQSGDGRRALNALDYLIGLEGDHPCHSLLRSRALWVSGDHAGARECFSHHLLGPTPPRTSNR
ncbi:tetratricopeptide repeat protein [Pseudomonas rhizosphaerae]|uniref:tetratricopeptide repeat protein n=1 Tax=Pseudomonas rhizosphaerae TaxID=216142 RepID=UPI001FD4CD38|nr:type III secretion protein [Pseudomonas rhizosphaerae]MEB2869461.1 type III secretion protein [Pseudomonas rhizosphaerae]